EAHGQLGGLVERRRRQLLHEVEGLGRAVQVVAVVLLGRVGELLALRHGGGSLVVMTPGEVVPVVSVVVCSGCSGVGRCPGAAGPGQDQPATVLPIGRAVPATWSLAASMSLAWRSGSLDCAISVSWASVMVPAASLPGLTDPFARPAASRMRTGVG